ncbi:MAG: GntR family transcriptional regulator [Desulfobacter sp.]|nr:MAG: GntR family transcriptional regulator [Desulfobacter sp.]
MTTRKEKAHKQPLALVAYEAIVRRIISLEYQPSQHLEECQLVEELGIGRTPIREALVRLQSEKMVESHPNKGVIVRPITLQNTKAMFESTGIFEAGVVDIAVTKNCVPALKKMRAANAEIGKTVKHGDLLGMVEANHDFHMALASASQNEFLIRAVHDVRCEAKRLSYLSYNTVVGPEQSLEDHYASVIEEHEQIIACLEAKDGEGLKQLLTHHLETFRKRIVQFMVS